MSLSECWGTFLVFSTTIRPYQRSKNETLILWNLPSPLSLIRWHLCQHNRDISTTYMCLYQPCCEVLPVWTRVSGLHRHGKSMIRSDQWIYVLCHDGYSNSVAVPTPCQFISAAPSSTRAFPCTMPSLLSQCSSVYTHVWGVYRFLIHIIATRIKWCSTIP